MRVLITGGAGFIGSHTAVSLIEQGNEVVIVDSLVNSAPDVVERIHTITGVRPAFYGFDVRDEDELDRVFAEAVPDAVIHFAGLKAVGESVANPLEYYSHNIDAIFSVLRVMQRHGVGRLVFSSSATVYGDNQPSPYTESGGLLEATNPYGQSKVMQERILVDVARADPSMSVALLRYFNPIGAHPSGLIGEDPSGIPNNIAPFITRVAIGQLPEVSIFGDDYDTADGTGERDYVHVMDLAEGHVAALRAITQSPGIRAWNLGTGTPTSVLQLIAAFERATGRQIPRRMTGRRPGDLARVWASTALAERELDWRATRSIDEMAADAWRWQSKNPYGYASPPSGDGAVHRD